jgi:hypothetical protein
MKFTKPAAAATAPLNDVTADAVQEAVAATRRLPAPAADRSRGPSRKGWRPAARAAGQR